MADTWLSLTGICDRLRLSPHQIRTLAKKGCLASIGGKGNVEKRYLDPTPEYVEQLRIGAILHQRHFPVPAGLSEKALLTAAECAELLGFTMKGWGTHQSRNAIKGIKVDRSHVLYSPAVVREAMLKRSKKTLSRQKSSFLLSELIEIFRSRLDAELDLIPTDAEFREDDKLQQRLSMIVAESQKADFAQKVKLAHEIVQILDSANTNASPK